MRPDRLILRAYLTRAVKLWLVSRILITVVFLFAGVDPLRLSVAAILEVVLVVVAIGFLDIRRHHESALLDNLAVSPRTLVALFAGPALAGEIAFRIAVAMLS
jgi:hypothetical protein